MLVHKVALYHKKECVSFKASSNQGLEATQCYYHSIMLVMAIHKIILDSREAE